MQVEENDTIKELNCSVYVDDTANGITTSRERLRNETIKMCKKEIVKSVLQHFIHKTLFNKS